LNITEGLRDRKVWGGSGGIGPAKEEIKTRGSRTIADTDSTSQLNTVARYFLTKGVDDERKHLQISG
jgi:hypothetical protein